MTRGVSSVLSGASRWTVVTGDNRDDDHASIARDRVRGDAPLLNAGAR